MKLVNRFLCTILVASAAAQAQSVPSQPYRSASTSKTVGASGTHASATATFAGEIGGGLQAGKKGVPSKLVAHGGARASADVSLFGKKLRVAGLDAQARSELLGSTASASASLELTVCNFSLKKPSSAGAAVLPSARKELIVFKAQTTFMILVVPVTVKGSFGAGMNYALTATAWKVGDRIKGGGAPMAVGLQGSAAIYALISLKAEISIGFAGAGVGGDGQLLRTELQLGLGASNNGPTGYLRLVVTSLRVRIYVYAWIDLPGRKRDEARRYIADFSVGGATYNLISF
jgi:hypothetical protein